MDRLFAYVGKQHTWLRTQQVHRYKGVGENGMVRTTGAWEMGLGRSPAKGGMLKEAVSVHSLAEGKREELPGWCTAGPSHGCSVLLLAIGMPLMRRPFLYR
jgi:hypothetical protein